MEDRILKDKARILKQVKNKHRQKMCFLLEREGRAIPSYLKASDVNDKESSNKKNRKFIKRNKYRRKKRQLDRKMQAQIVTNYSDKVLTNEMKSFCQLGLNFAMVPKKVNTTAIQAGFEKMSRTMKWTEYFYDQKDTNFQQDPSSSFKALPWKPVRTNLPDSAPSPDLKTFVNGSLACVLGSDLNKTHTNISPGQARARDQLIQWQKDREVTIKPSDKTGGICVLNTDEYVASMESILNLKFMDKDGSELEYFRKLDQAEADQLLHNHHHRLQQEVDEAKRLGYIDKDQASWLVPEEPAAGRLYGLVKDHVAREKWPEGSKIPPMRPVVSASGTTFENASHLVDYYSNDLVKGLDSYWQDTPDMLRDFASQNEAGPQPPGTIPVSLDISSLYTNIPIAEGIDVFRNFLDKRQDQSIPTCFLITLLTLVLTCNIFVFDSNYYLQLIGTAMGTRAAPTFACLFMAAVEIVSLTEWKGIKPRLYKRYIDDIFFLWNGTEAQLIEFINYLNSFHPYLKFKASYDFVNKSVIFLDTIISISDDGFIKTDLYVKPGRKCNYLLPSSCHPKHITQNIPFSLALRLKRICSDNVDFLKQLDILKTTLLSRGYRRNFVSEAFEKVKVIERKNALQRTEKEVVKRIALTLPYDPRLPNISNILYRFWNVMTKNPRLKRIFPQPPMICWTRPKNIRDTLIKAKLPSLSTSRKSNRRVFGFKHCKRFSCNMCKFSPKFAKSIVCSSTKNVFKIKSELSCISKNVIYCITCKKQDKICNSKPQYIGQTSRRIFERFNEHRSSVKPESKKAVGAHFSSNGHTVNDMEIVPLECVRSDNPWIRISREKYYINEFEPFLNVRK